MPYITGAESLVRSPNPLCTINSFCGYTELTEPCHCGSEQPYRACCGYGPV